MSQCGNNLNSVLYSTKHTECTNRALSNHTQTASDASVNVICTWQASIGVARNPIPLRFCTHKKSRVRRSRKMNSNQYRFSFDRWVNLLLATGKQCSIYRSKTRDCVPTFFFCVKDGYRKKGEWVCGVYHTLQEFVLKLFQDNVVFVWDLRSGWPCSYCKNKHHWSFNVHNLNRIKELGKTRFLNVICGHLQASNMHEMCRFRPPNNVIVHGEHKIMLHER